MASVDTSGRAWWGVAAPAGAYDRGGWTEVSFPDQNVEVALKVGDVEGEPQVVGLRLESRGARPVAITRRRLGSLPLGQLLDNALEKPPRGFVAIGALPPRRGPQPIPEATLERVAAIYADAVRHRRHPLTAIMGELKVGRSTASKYVTRARRHEPPLLGWPERKGRPGLTSQKSPYPVRRPSVTRATKWSARRQRSRPQ